MNVAAYLVAGYLVAAVYAIRTLRGETVSEYSKRAMLLGLLLGGISAPLQFLVDYTAKMVAGRNQSSWLRRKVSSGQSGAHLCELGAGRTLEHA